MKKLLFDEIKKSLKNPTPLNQMESVIHVKKINNKYHNGTQSTKKSSELSQELVEYYKMQQNERSEFIQMNSEQSSSPFKLEKSEDFSIKTKVTASVPSYVDSFQITPSIQALADHPKQKQLFKDKLNRTFNDSSNQNQWNDVVLEGQLQRKTEGVNPERRQVIIKKREQKKYTNEILTALAQNRLISLKPRLRTESIGMVNGHTTMITQYKNNGRCSTQPNEQETEGQEYFQPNFENSILASNFNNVGPKIKAIQLKDKQYNRSMEASPQRKHLHCFMKNYQKKNQQLVQKSTSFDLQSIQCMSQEYIQRGENPTKVQQSPEEKQPFRFIHERQLRLSQPDMNKWKESEFPVDDYLKTIKLQNKSSIHNMSQMSDYPISDHLNTRPHSRVHTSMSPEKSRKESPLSKRMASIKRSNKIQHNTILSSKNSIILDNLSSSMFTASQELTFNDLVDNTHIQNQAKFRNYSVNHNNWVGNSQQQLQQQQLKQNINVLQFTMNSNKKYEPQQSIECNETNQLQNSQIFQNRHIKTNPNNSSQNSAIKPQTFHLLQNKKHFHQLQNINAQSIKL